MTQAKAATSRSREPKKRGSAAAKKAATTRRKRGSAAGGRRVQLLNPKVRKALLDTIRAGSFAGVAAQYAGIGRSTYFSWLQRGRTERARVEALRSEGLDPAEVDPAKLAAEAPYLSLLDDIEQAEAAAEIRAVTTLASLMGAATDDNVRARAASYFLERKHRERWGRSERHDVVVGGDESRPIAVRVETEQLERTTTILGVLVEVGALPAGDLALPALESGPNQDDEGSER